MEPTNTVVFDQSTTPNSFLSEFLSKRELTTATDEPLYRYKIQEYEFQALAEILRKYETTEQGWETCFALYASEWCRRNLENGYRSWEPITAALGKKLTPNERSRLVQNGFQSWNIEVSHNDRRNHYLGTVVRESGIPRNWLNEDHYLGQIIIAVYKELGSISSTEDGYLDAVKAIAGERLPQSLDNDEFFELLLKVVVTLANLKEQFQLAEKENPIEHLNENLLNWRAEFPVRFDEHSTRFLDRLLSEVASQEGLSIYSIKTFHQLINSNGEWRCKAYLAIEPGMHNAESLGIPEDDFLSLPKKLEIILDDGEIERRIGFAFKLTEKKALRIDGLEKFLLPHGLKSLSIYISDPGKGKRYIIETAYENVLGYHEPLIFSRKNDRWLLTSSGSTKIETSECLIVTNENDDVECSSLTKVDSSLPEKVVYKICDDCVVKSDGNIFRIRLNNIDEQYRYEFHQKNNAKALKFCRRENKEIFIGIPRIYRLRGENSIASKVISGLEYKVKDEWRELNNNIVGQLKIRQVKNGETQFYRTISVLPEDLKVDIEQDHLVIVRNASPLSLSIVSDIKSQIESDEDVKRIRFQDSVENVDTRFFIINLRNRETGSHVELTVPYPKNEVQFYGKDQRKLDNKAKLFYNELHGTRLNITNLDNRNRKYGIEFRLIDRFENLIATTRRVVSAASFSNESISLVSYQQYFVRLFSLTDDIDARIEMNCNNQKVDIRQFVARPRFKENKHLLLPSERIDLNTVRPKAFRLDRPFNKETVVNLEYDSEESGWLLPEENGVWMVLPAEDSGTYFRPGVFKTVTESISTESGADPFKQLAEADYSERIAQYRKTAVEMAYNFNDPEWNALYELFKETKHLPLATMDIWKAFVQEPEGLIAAALYFSDEFVGKVTEEFSIIWQMFPVSSWVEITSLYFDFVQKTYPNYSEQLIKSKLEELETVLELGSVRLIVEKGNVDPISIEQLQAVINVDLNGMEGYSGLLARHLKDQWPDQLSEKLTALFRLVPREVRHTLPRNLFIPYQPVIYLPFVLAAASVTPELINLPEFDASERFCIQEMIEFDEEWFKRTYDLIQAFMFQNKEI